MNKDFIINSFNIDEYLTMLADEICKYDCKEPVELSIVGGAAIILKYKFKNYTRDIDIINPVSDILAKSIDNISARLNIPRKWIDNSITRLNKYTDKYHLFLKYYKTYKNVLNVYIIDVDGLIVSKLVSARKLKNDITDVVNILYEQKLLNHQINYDIIDDAMIKIYGDWNFVDDYVHDFIKEIMKIHDLSELIDEIKSIKHLPNVKEKAFVALNNYKKKL